MTIDFYICQTMPLKVLQCIQKYTYLNLLYHFVKCKNYKKNFFFCKQFKQNCLILKKNPPKTKLIKIPSMSLGIFTYSINNQIIQSFVSHYVDKKELSKIRIINYLTLVTYYL